MPRPGPVPRVRSLSPLFYRTKWLASPTRTSDPLLSAGLTPSQLALGNIHVPQQQQQPPLFKPLLLALPHYVPYFSFRFAVRTMVKMFSAVLGYVVLGLASSVVAKDCHCLPGDSDGCWPSPDKWNALNGTVGGKLVKVVPIGAVCHDPTYDEAACTALKANWDEVETQ